MGIKTEGRRFATLISHISSILKPRPIIKSPPAAVTSLITVFVKSPLSDDAASVIIPWYKKTETEDNITPIPRDEEKIIDEIPSSMDFANKVL